VDHLRFVADLVALWACLLWPRLLVLLAPAPPAEEEEEGAALGPKALAAQLPDVLVPRWSLLALGLLPDYGYSPGAAGLVELEAAACALRLRAVPRPAEWLAAMSAVRFLRCPAALACWLSGGRGGELTWHTPGPPPGGPEAGGRNLKPVAVRLDPRGLGVSLHAHGLFEQYLHTRHRGRVFPRCLEWGGGPGAAGFALLGAGVCETLVVLCGSDEGAAAAMRTVEDNGLRAAVKVRVGRACLHALPVEEAFDLVVGVPPPALRNTLWGPNADDPGWEAHGAFYRHVGAHLSPGAVVLSAEVRPGEAAAPLLQQDSLPFDWRPGPPVEAWRRDMEVGGLRLVEVAESAAVPYLHVVACEPALNVEGSPTE